MPVLLAIGVPLLGAACILTAPRAPRWGTAVGAAFASLLLVGRAAVVGASVDWSWVPSWRARVQLEADGTGLLLAGLAAGVGLLVIAYSRTYIPHHVRRHDAPEREERRFLALMLLFLSAMLLLAFARDLLLIFVAFDVTAVCSYFLIAFDRDRPPARRAALMAMIVTGVTSIGLLAGALILHSAAGTFNLDALRDAPLDAGTRTLAGILIAVAALAKSAQVPLHFWLPRAMAAPTPVSAYLHSAAMVASGAFVLLRVAPLLEGTAAHGMLPYVGMASILTGSVLALTADVLKQLLAYSTIAQYGYIILLLGAPAGTGLAAAALYLTVHAVAKSGLFLTAGAVTRATGEDRLSRLTGVGRGNRALAASSAVLAATLAGLPLTAGYWKDEALFAVMLEAGPGFAAASVAAAVLTLGYSARFWFGTFTDAPVLHVRETRHSSPVVQEPVRGSALAAEDDEEKEGRDATDRGPAPVGLVWPVAVLAVIAVAGAATPGPLSQMAAAAAGPARESPELGYHLSRSLALAVTAWVLGGTLYATRGLWASGLARVRAAGVKVGPEALYEQALAGLNRVSDRMHRLEVRDLRDRIAAILMPAGLLVVIALSSVAGRTEWRVGEMGPGHAPLTLTLVVLAAASLIATTRRTHLALVLALTSFGFTLAAVYALIGAPGLVLVAVLVETTLTLFLLGAFGAPPTAALGVLDAGGGGRRVQRRRHRVAGAVGGVVAFVVAWSTLSTESEGSVADTHVAWSERVHATDPVAAILSDFRGLDTAGEATVLVVALFGMATLVQKARAR